MNSTTARNASDHLDPPTGLGRAAATGMMLLTLATGAGRLVSLVAQLVLGWLLSESEFGLYGLAISVSLLVMQLRAIGTDRILMQRATQFDSLAAPVARLTLFVNLIGAVLLAAVAPIAAWFYGTTELIYLIWIIAASLPLGVPAQVLRAKLSIQLRFRRLAAANLASFSLRHGLVILLAFLGFGPYSFAWPAVAVALFDWLLFRTLAGSLAKGRRLDKPLVLELLGASKWILACGLAAALVTQGTILVMGKLESQVITGVFFFGLQLTVSLADLFKSSMYPALVPTLSRLTTHRRRQGDAYHRAAKVLSYTLSPICGGLALLAVPAIHLLWQGKWDAAADVVRYLTIVLPIYLLFNLGGVLLEARGMWQANFWVHACNAGGTLIAAVIGCWWGGVAETAICLAAFRVLTGLVQSVYACKLLSQSSSRLLLDVLLPWLYCVGCILAAVVVVNQAGYRGMPAMLLQLAVFSIAVFFGYLLLMTNHRRLTWDALRRRNL